MVTEQKFPVETSAPSYFKRNKVISWLTNLLSPSSKKDDKFMKSSIRDSYVNVLG